MLAKTVTPCEARTVGVDHPNYKAVKTALKEENWAALPDLLDISKSVRQAIVAQKVDNVLQVKDGEVLYNGDSVHNTIVDRIISFVNKNLPFQPLLNSLQRALRNPSKVSLDNYYRFLEHNQMPILEDGCFIAYKRVDNDYLDLYEHRFDNTPGKTVSMPRNQVEDDPTVTCSHGLHVASLAYARDVYSAGKGRLVIVKVDPEHVVSVPTDYNNAKMRVCKYEVLEDFKGEELKQENMIMPVAPVAEDFDDDDEDFDDDDSWVVDEDDEDDYYGDDDEDDDDEDF